MKIILGIFIGLVVLILVYAGICIYVASQLTKSVPSPLTQDPRVISETFKDVSITTADNFTLKGWFFKNPDSKNIIIFVNGTNQNREGSDYRSFEIAQELYKNGYSILLFDRRTTGESDGSRITFGLPERLDVIAAVKYAEEQGFTRSRIGILANSIGAIATLMAIDSIQNVGAIILDSTAARVKPIVENILQNEQHIPSFMNFGIFTAAKLLYQVDLDKIQPVEKLVYVPDLKLLYLHGAKDPVIPLSNSEELLKNSNPESKLVIFPEAAHVQTYTSNPELYRKEVFSFLEEQLGK